MKTIRWLIAECPWVAIWLLGLAGILSIACGLLLVSRELKAMQTTPHAEVTPRLKLDGQMVVWQTTGAICGATKPTESNENQETSQTSTHKRCREFPKTTKWNPKLPVSKNELLCHS